MNELISEMLCSGGYISQQDIERVYSAKNGAEHIVDTFARLGIISEREILNILGQRLHIAVLPTQMPQSDSEVVKLIPKQTLKKYRMLPLSAENGQLFIATADPLNDYAKEDIKQLTGMTPRYCLCESRFILQGIDYYSSDIDERAEMTSDSDDSDAVKTVDSLISKAHSLGASDIHIEPFENEISVRMRTDGTMLDYALLRKDLHSGIIARIKILADLDIAEHRLPQDGNIHIKRGEKSTDMRVSVMPTIYGEKAVLRFLDTDIKPDNADQFGMDSYSYKKTLELLNAPNGLIYFTGPTGSGKTTTLYMILEELAKRPVNICTIEDPVERRIKRVIQTAVNTAAGMDFSTGLRAVLRQDPDIIMLGETRDSETAEMSVRAAITGHLVLSTLHTNDAVSAVIRLQDMGIPSYLSANALIGVVAQRLIRKNCPNCSAESFPTAEESEIIGHEVRFIRRGKGCHLCNYTGYKGRTAIFEILKVDKTVKEMITRGESTEAIYSYAIDKQGMKTLKQAAKELVYKGETTPEEVLRAAYFADQVM